MSLDWVSFTTDYGTADGFVGACHGVMARIAPHARVLDITHDIVPGDIRRGAAVLADTVTYLPPAVHLAVVDPGVGTGRRGLAIVTGPAGTAGASSTAGTAGTSITAGTAGASSTAGTAGATGAAGVTGAVGAAVLVGPDNGLLLPAADALGGVTAAYELAEPGFWLPTVSRTFHGRDVFAPVAAHLANGVDPAALGPGLVAADLVRLPEPIVHARPGTLTTEVLAIDRFGNVQLAAIGRHVATAGFAQGETLALTVEPPPPHGPAAPGRAQYGPRTVPREPFLPDWPDPPPPGRPPRNPSGIPGEPFVPDRPFGRTLHATVGQTFAEVAPGELVVLIDSAGHAAIAANGTSAADLLAAPPGTLITLRHP